MESDVREGFLCPICVQDLGSFHKLQHHFETSHSAEDKAVFDQIKGLFSKAKGRIFKREEELQESSSHSGGFQPITANNSPVWEPQELGATRSHLESFKKIRDARIDRFVIESNKVLIRLDKLLSHVRLTGKGNTKEFEQTLVPWVKDSDVPFCPTCGGRFNVARRRHHCRLCGAIMCTRCSLYVPIELAGELVQTLKKSALMDRRSRSDVNLSHPAHRDPELSIRCCHECYKVLHKRKDKMDQQANQPLLVMLYERLHTAIESATKAAPEYQHMADSLNQGEEEYDLNKANEMRFKLIKFYETIDVISKKIAALDTNDEENPPSSTALRLQNSIRRSSHAYLQENMLTLQSLPSLPKLEILQKERRKQQEQRMRRQMEEAEQERADAKRRQDLERLKKERYMAEKKLVEPELPSTVNYTSHPKVMLAEGWSSDAPISKELLQKKQHIDDDDDEPDPILEQILYVEQMITQARAAGRKGELQSLNLNLEELKSEYRKQRSRKAFSSISNSSSPSTSRNQHTVYNGNPFLEESDRSTLVVNSNPFLNNNGNHRNPFLSNDSPSNLASKNPFVDTFSPVARGSDTGDDPMFQQICYISQCLDEAMRLGKRDEAAMLRDNLKELQALYNSS